jgi:lysozyme family protein
MSKISCPESERGAISSLISREGGFTNDIHDHGGPTKYGIIGDDLREWFGREPTIDDIRMLDIGVAVDIYYNLYWVRFGINALSPISRGIALAVFDWCVMSGKNGIKPLQQALGVKVDGMIGPTTILALQRACQLDHEEDIIKLIINLRVEQLISICVHERDQVDFLLGWYRRTQMAHTFA